MGITRKQLILVGDSGCGKSALALRLTHALFAESYIPTTFESRTTDIITESGNTKLILQDTSGSKDCQALRKLAYEGCCGVLLCFDLTNKSSYESIETRWVPEINSMAPGVPVFLAGCKKDSVQTDRITSEQKIEELVQRIGATGYLECSAFTDENVEKIFKELVEAKTPKQKSNLKKALDSVKLRSDSIRKLL